MASAYKTTYNYLGSLLAALALLFFLIFFLFAVAGIGDVGMGKLFNSVPTLLSMAGFIIIGPVMATMYFQKTGQPSAQEYVNRSILRYVIAMLMVFYGWGKMHHKFFDITYLAQDTRLADVDSFNLAWYFFGRSNVQEFLIGLMEFVPAILLLFRRTTFIGCLILLPVELNVLMVNTFNHISGFTFPLSIFISLAGIYLLYGWKDEIRRFLATTTESNRPQLRGIVHLTRWPGKVLIGGTIIYLVGGSLISSIIPHAKNYAYTNKFKGGFELSSLEVNGQPVTPSINDSMYYKSIYLEPQSRWNCIISFAAGSAPKAITVKWNSANDSVHTYLKRNNDVTMDAVDSATAFTGTYTLAKDTLYVKGKQYGSIISARYYKKHLHDYNWFW